MRSLILWLAVLAAAGCASRPPLVDEGAAQAAQPVAGSAGSGALREIAVPRGIHFGYKIYGDPGAAPSQAFDDGRFLFLQFKQGVPPPIPVTRDGKLLEYEVMQGGLIRTARVDSVVLRLGPRAAFVDRADLEIVALAASPNTSAAGVALPAPPSVATPAGAPALKVEPPPQPQQAPEARKEQEPKREVEQLQRLTLRWSDSSLPSALDPGLWRLCHAPTLRDFAAAQSMRDRLQRDYAGVRVALTDACQTPGQAVLERLAQTR